MPGRLMMEQHAAASAEDVKQEYGAATNTMQGNARNGTQTNGVPLSNGTPVPGPHVAAKQEPLSEDDQKRLPPELEHWTSEYKPMGLLLERMAQQCHFDLLETVDAMADMPVPQSASGTNGISGHGNAHPDPSEASLKKKRRLMEFAQTQKDRFIKALVLSDWARNMDDIDKLIDLTMWLRKQDGFANDAANGIMWMKQNFTAAKMPNPNIEGALELLSTGKAPWMPDLGYIPSKPLTARQLLKTLRDMNFTLSTRLNLYEELPRHFHEYTIANGRATFTVPGEFEVDLAVADEDPESPFYFIDIRLLFSPAPPIPDGPIRGGLEGKVNEILAAKGLTGCYDFLHGFVQTHKINVLKRQAFEMARRKWSEHMRIEPVHRSLVVQYWAAQAGKKNWLEVGISSGMDGRKKPTTSQIQCRWFRRGVESAQHGLEFDLVNLSAEQMLNRVVARHSSGRLTMFRDQLASIAGMDTALSMDLQTSDKEPADCSLTMQLATVGTKITIAIEPVTGHVVISPPTATSNETEARWNQDPTTDAGRTLAYLHCKMLQEKIVEQAQRIGWVLLPTAKQDNNRSIFKEDVMRRIIFTKEGWEKTWAIAATISLSGEKWWAVRLEESPAGHKVVKFAERLPTSGSNASNISRQSLRHVQRVAVGVISILAVIQELHVSHIPYKLHKYELAPSSAGAETADTLGLWINFRALLRGAHSKTWKPWASDYLHLSHYGLSKTAHGGEANVLHVLRGVLTAERAQDLAKHISSVNRSTSSIAFREDGAFGLLFQTSLGLPLVSQMKSRLLSIDRLSSYLAVLKSRGFQTSHVSLERLVFKYASSPALTAELLFSNAEDGESMETRLKLLPEDVNPHRRIRVLLQNMLNIAQKDPDAERAAFLHFAKTLSFTLPLLRQLNKMEAADPAHMDVTVHARTPTNYKVVYHAPLPYIAFNISAKEKHGKKGWHVEDVKVAKQDRSEALSKGLKEVWADRGDGWIGLRNCAIAGHLAVEVLMERIDALMRAFKVEEDSTKREQEGRGNEIVILD
ncbi:mediator complex subunit [Zalaria obscura]|uniref:Mediator complex subunit n=1 Tax=Zalaria obscura TaxID=2024903 RepID=A0ACC3SQC0_9PEZI